MNNMTAIYIVVIKYKGKKGWTSHHFRRYYWTREKAEEAAKRYKKMINWDAHDTAKLGVQSLKAEGGGVIIV